MTFNQNVLSQLHGMVPGGISVGDFSMITKTNDLNSKRILDGYIKNGIGKKQENKYYFEDADKEEDPKMLVSDYSWENVKKFLQDEVKKLI